MEKVGIIVAGLGALVVIAILLAWPVQLLWNYSLVGVVEGINPITFWQALGINILCGILFRNNNTSE